jgi:hypothetical protein
MLLRQSDGQLDDTTTPPRRRAGDRLAPTHPVHGSWAATRWQYASRAHPERVVDVVTGLGGSVTLGVSDSAYVLSWSVPGHGAGNVGGTIAIRGAHLELLAAGAASPESLLVHLSGETLALSSDASAWDFDGNGEEPADFVAVLVRL